MLACKMGYEYKYPPKIVDLRFERMINNKKLLLQVLLLLFCFPVFGQKNQGLYILQFHNAGKDTLFNEAIEGLQNYFLSESDAIIYIAKIPSLLAAKGYPSASVDSTWNADSASTGIMLYTGQKFKWVNLAPVNIEPNALEAAGNKLFPKNLEILFQYKVPHISCYALTVEPKTALHHLIEKKKYPPVNTDEQANAFETICILMKENGYEQYEISNFCRHGFRSRHNSSYWQGKPYWGFGPAAHSFNGKNKRRWNIANNTLYLQSIRKNNIPFEEEILTMEQQMNEAILISLRTSEGLGLENFSKKFGKNNAEKLLQNAQKFIAQKKMIFYNQRLVLQDEGKFLADGIAADLFF